MERRRRRIPTRMAEENEKRTRTLTKAREKQNNTTYHWYPHHDTWALFKPADCRENLAHPDYKAPRATTPLQTRTHDAHAAEKIYQFSTLSMIILVHMGISHHDHLDHIHCYTKPLEFNIFVGLTP